jgi:peptidoglycan/LPS O-acetylase OafA/YrhL
MKQPESYRSDIDGLRGIAVMSVVLFHAFPDIFPGGFVGVDIFFVISGYLISSIIFSGMDNNTFRFRDFYARRIRRIFPALIAVLIGCLLMGGVLMNPGEYMTLGLHIFSSSIFVENFLLSFETGYFDTAAELKPLLHLWSLSAEEQFYLFFPFLILIIKKYRLDILVVFFILSVLSLGINFVYLAQETDRVFYLLHYRFWELAAGGILAYMQLYQTGSYHDNVKNNKNLFFSLLAALGLLLILLSLTLGGHTKENSLIASWLISVVGAWLLIFSGPKNWISKYILSTRIIVFVGLVSYPFYLWHWPLLSFFRLAQVDQSISSATKIVAIVLGFFLAVITYQWLERPIRYGRSGQYKIAILVCLLATVGIIGVYIFINQGLPARYPERLQAVASYQFDYDANTNARREYCWVGLHDPPDQFSEICIGSLASSSAVSVLLWGDSYAANFHSGLDQELGGTNAVAEFTRDACAPVFLDDNSNCALGNRHILSIIKKYKPETVVLFADWKKYSDSWIPESTPAKQLLNTLNNLNLSGVKYIIVMGPAPGWSARLPDMVLDETLTDAPFYKIPVRTNNYVDFSVKVTDKEFRNLVEGIKNVQYFSTFDALCNNDGCLVRTTNEPTSFTTFDYGHFTLYGASYVAQQLRKVIVTSPVN